MGGDVVLCLDKRIWNIELLSPIQNRRAA